MQGLYLWRWSEWIWGSDLIPLEDLCSGLFLSSAEVTEFPTSTDAGVVPSKHCTSSVDFCKVQLQLPSSLLVSTVEDNKKDFLKYVNSKRRIREITLLLHEVSQFTNQDVDKVKTSNAFFTFVFDTRDGPWDPGSPVPEDCGSQRGW